MEMRVSVADVASVVTWRFATRRFGAIVGPVIRRKLTEFHREKKAD